MVRPTQAIDTSETTAPARVRRIARGHPMRSTSLPAGAEARAATVKKAVVSKPRPTASKPSSGPAWLTPAANKKTG